MKTFVAVDHDGRWKHGKSVVVAPSLREARKLLDAALEAADLLPSVDFPYTLKELEPPIALILDDGDQLHQGLT